MGLVPFAYLLGEGAGGAVGKMKLHRLGGRRDEIWSIPIMMIFLCIQCHSFLLVPLDALLFGVFPQKSSDTSCCAVL